MRAGLLRGAVIEVFKHETTGRDPYGGQIVEWTKVARLWAEVNPRSMRAELNDRRQAGESAIALRVRAPLDVDLGHRIVFEGTNYEVVAVDATRKFRGELMLTAKAEDTSA
jgi:SPP1 family predicted phage head-tail adaptor